jgi:hypothetical protein
MSSEGDVRINVSLVRRASPDFALAPPDLTQSPRLSIEQWETGKSADGALTLAWGCVRADASAWSRDATDVTQGKLAELASSTAARLRGEATPMHVTASADDGRDRALASDDTQALSQARTFVAFTSGQAHGCFVTCSAHGAAGQPATTCDDSVHGATLAGDLHEPPPPGLLLDSLAFVVHHPQTTLAMLAGGLVFVAVLAIVTRRRH